MRPKFLIQLREQHGVWVMIRDANKVPASAEKLIGALNAAGVEVKGEATDVVDGDRVEMMIGLP